VTAPFEVGYGAIAVPEMTDAEAQEFGEKTGQFIKRVDPNAPGCCIDGRGCSACMDGNPTELRPSVAGGPVMTAYAAAEAIGWFADNDTSSIEDRLVAVEAQLAHAGIQAGGHVDAKAVANQFVNPETGQAATGCGANDKAPAIVATPYERPAETQALTQAVMGSRYDETYQPKNGMGYMQNRFAEWNSKTYVDVTQRKDAHRVEILEAGHEEAYVIFNFNEATTFDRDAFLQSTGKQAFCVDAWYIDNMARAMATGPDAEQQYKQLFRAMVEYQAATYLVLCNGSQRGVVVQPAEVPA
jgi:hypothetical protein